MVQVFARLDDITITAPVHLLSDIFQICSEELAVINIRTVPRKSHILLNETDRLRLPDNLNPEIQILTDGIPLLGTAIGSDDFIEEFLDQKLQNIATHLRKMDKIQSTIEIPNVKIIDQLET